MRIAAAKLARKLRCRIGTLSNFRDKTNVSVEAGVRQLRHRRTFLLFQILGSDYCFLLLNHTDSED